MSTIKNLFFALMMVNSGIGASAQMTIGNITVSKHESYFLYEVKLIDEFIERFNDEQNSYVRTQTRAIYGTDSMINRKGMISSLFNSGKKWGSEKQAFINDVTGANQQYINFTDTSWYAEVECSFLYNNKKVVLPLILHIHTAAGASKWMIVGIGGSDFLSLKTSIVLPNNNTRPGNFIPTSSHGTDFVVFHNIFTADMHAADYMEPQLITTNNASAFVQAVRQGKLQFRHVNSIKYHFYGLPFWVFSVSEFKKKGVNTGWLISHLTRVDDTQKNAMKEKLLNP